MNSNGDIWRELGSANVSDAMRKCGKAFQCMDGGIRPLSLEMHLAGPAFTVRCFPGATWALEKALDLASPGEVLVVDGGGYPDAILMGELMSTRAAARGLAGAVVDGAVRDVEGILRLGFAVFSRHICPRAGTFAEIGEWQTIVCCGRIPVRPGDWIVADASGVAVIPTEMLDQVKAEALAIHQREGRMADFLHEGRTLSDSASAAKAHGKAAKVRV